MAKSYIVIEDSESNFLDRARIVGAIAFNSSPARKIKKRAGEAGKLIDATQGKRTKTLIITDTGYVWQTSFTRDALLNKLK